uniref:Uncharacterized protein n=1 Tax=Daphnia magna TaxID=35525 RepID=A0A0P5BAH7_9CRUS
MLPLAPPSGTFRPFFPLFVSFLSFLSTERKQKHGIVSVKIIGMPPAVVCGVDEQLNGRRENAFDGP